VFHLVLDSTSIALDDCVEIIAEAARRKGLPDRAAPAR
jgi:hypothetical protein